MLNFNRHFPQNSLRNQLFKWLLLLLLPLIFVSAIAGYFLANHFTNQVYDKSLYRTALALAGQIDTDTTPIEVNLPQIAKDLVEFDEDDSVYFRIISSRGDLVSTHISLPLPKKYPAADNHLFYKANLNDANLRVIVYALPHTKKNQQRVYVMVGETQQKRVEMADDIVLSMLLPQLLIILLISALLFFGIKRGLMPLEQLKAELISRNNNDLSPVNSDAAPSELKPLLESLNHLLLKVDSNIAKQHRFIADASHQLRTPLAGLKTQAELALREENPQKIRHALEQINVASANLSHLVSQLLSLAKAEPNASRALDFKPIDLCKLAQTVTADWVAIAIQKQIDLGYASTLKSALINGNEALLRELLNNLIDNAIHYTQVGGNITVGIEHIGLKLNLTVKDNGFGIAPANQALVFERFYRVLGTQQTGCGLGLTIVQQIAESHYAAVELFSEGEGKGSFFTVRFAILPV